MFEIGKRYRTRCGEEARIYATDGGSDFPIHGAILSYSIVPPGRVYWRPYEWRSNGMRKDSGELYKDDLMGVIA